MSTFFPVPSYANSTFCPNSPLDFLKPALHFITWADVHTTTWSVMPQAKPCKDYLLENSPNYWPALFPFRAPLEWVIHTEDLPLIISQGFLKLSVCSDPLLLTEVTFQEPDQWQNISFNLTVIVKTVDCSLLYKNCWSWDKSFSVSFLPISVSSQSPSLVPLFSILTDLSLTLVSTCSFLHSSWLSCTWF